MNKLYDELERVREHLKFLSKFDIKNETHPGGLLLAVSDWIAEEVLLMEELNLGYEERVENLYNAATKRAEERKTDALNILSECRQGFEAGLRTALGHPSYERYLERALSESNFGFAFVCGVMAVLEAIKGKGYKASWQAEGEDSALANIKRKYDRLKALKGTEPGALSFEDRPTTAADLAVYGIKLTTWFNEFNPAGFKAWINEVKKIASMEGTNAKQETQAVSNERSR
jgi:hypothetical protein